MYGADAYLERPDLPEGLRTILVGFGLPIHDAVSPTVAAEPMPPPEPRSPAAAVQPEPAPAAPSLQPERATDPDTAVAKAERLARIVVSDIVLYNEEKFDAALASGDVIGALSAEIAEGRSLLAARIPTEVREGRDFLVEELLRVASARGTK